MNDYNFYEDKVHTTPIVISVIILAIGLYLYFG